MIAIVYAGLMPESVGSGPPYDRAVGKRVGGGDGRVVEADDLPLVAEELPRERVDLDAALRADDEIEREADEVGLAREDPLPLLLGHRRAAREERGEVARRELLGLALHVFHRRSLREGARPAVVYGRQRHRRQRVDPAEDVVVGRVQRRDLESGRDENGPVQADAGALLEHAQQAADPVAAVALAGDEDR